MVAKPYSKSEVTILKTASVFIPIFRENYCTYFSLVNHMFVKTTSKGQKGFPKKLVLLKLLHTTV